MKEVVALVLALSLMTLAYVYAILTDISSRMWIIDYYVDDFGDDTDDAFLLESFPDGTFSNSAASGKQLTGQ